MAYGGERAWTDAALGDKGGVDVVVLESEDELRAFLEAAGAREGNASTKIVRGSGRRALMAVWYDAQRPAASELRVAAGVAQLAADGRPVDLFLQGVRTDARAALVVRVAKECFRLSTVGSLARVTFLGAGSRDRGDAAERLARNIRDAAELVNLPSNVVFPSSLARRLAAWAPAARVRVQVLEGAALRRAGLGLLEGIGRSGEHGPCALVVAPSGQGKTRARTMARTRTTTTTRPLVLLVGKGVTYDSGGLALKPLRSMTDMHSDMTGAAVAAAVARCFEFGAAPGCAFDVALVLPMAENLVSARAVRPGDVLVAADGTRVEVNNPDAEGRLLLADAIAYGCARFRPDAVVDFGTLTGSAAAAHPSLDAAFYAEDDAAAAALLEPAAGPRLGERAWRMPPWGAEDDWRVGSSVADCRNSEPGAAADGYLAAVFLRRFVPEALRARWVHVDLAQTRSATGDMFTCGGVELGVRLLPRLAALAAADAKKKKKKTKTH